MEEQWLRQADFLQHLFDAVPSFLFIVDDDVRIINVNAAAARLADQEEKFAMRQRGGDFLHCIYSFETPEGCGRSSHCKDCVIRNSVGKAIQGEGVYRETTRMNLLQGDNIAEIYVSVTTSPIYYQGKKLALLVMEDVTEQKNYEETLRQRSEDLESFSYSASHDLKSPLVAISGFSQMLVEDHGEKLDDEVKRALGIIVRNAKKMEQLLQDLLQFSRISTKEVKLNEIRIDMDALVREVWEDLKPAGGGREVDLLIKPLLPARGDRSMLRQVIVNLLSNAFKYTRLAERAKIEVGSAEQGNERIYYVRDNGVGFDMKYADKLFGLFSRLHGEGEFEGTGIGLVIIKRIIEKHGGRVWAESGPNNGAVFYFSLPGR
jgi:signal transduction histidine kinase